MLVSTTILEASCPACGEINKIGMTYDGETHKNIPDFILEITGVKDRKMYSFAGERICKSCRENFTVTLTVATKIQGKKLPL